MEPTATPPADTGFATLADRVRGHARTRPDTLAITDGDASLTYAELDRLIDRVAAALQREGVTQRNVVASVGSPSVGQAVLFLGTLRAGAVVAFIQPSATPEQIAGMIADADAGIVFMGADEGVRLDGLLPERKIVPIEALEAWLGSETLQPNTISVDADDAFNIIYSSGTTGVPKGIVVSHAMRADQFASYAELRYEAAVTLIATPLYSSTTLVAFLPTLAYGGSVVLMKRFDARRYLELAQRHRATHTMLVPVQYQRIMAQPDLDAFDLSAFELKFCTSAPFKSELKADVLKRWPGALIEFYGMTEGGGSTVLYASDRPDKLHTVGIPAPGHDIRLIDDDGCEVARGEMGEVVSRSGAMMSGYHGRSEATADATRIGPEGQRFIRHGDIGRLDEDGFLILMDRRKDVIISGGFNIYPSDLEAVLARHPAVADCAVVGVASERWGETPVGVYVAHEDAAASIDEVLAETNAKLGRTQRLSALHRTEELPRNAIGKVLKRELRDRLAVIHVA